nr:MAG TPA: hypothetical protein [Caudoviricetes sp.]
MLWKLCCGCGFSLLLLTVSFLSYTLEITLIILMPQTLKSFIG